MNDTVNFDQELTEGHITSYCWGRDFLEDCEPWQADLNMPGVGVIMSRFGRTRKEAVAKIKLHVPEYLRGQKQLALESFKKYEAKANFLQSIQDDSKLPSQEDKIREALIKSGFKNESYDDFLAINELNRKDIEELSDYLFKLDQDQSCALSEWNEERNSVFETIHEIMTVKEYAVSPLN